MLSQRNDLFNRPQGHNAITDMLYQEFTERVNIVVPTTEYYDIIEPMYNACDVEKDTFCKLWVKMNYRRVAAYKAEQKEKKNRQRTLDRLLKIENKLLKAESYEVGEDVLKERDIKVLESVGISIKEWFNPLPINGISEGFWRHRSSTSVWCEVHDYTMKALMEI